ncbi:uncharacterized protein LOC111638044 [Centruroides sculpturatus]|uniref:uncharacterized protein LOC111638044 n=1 Tax=Centruroides sculpturatus TaxID=218467 RepID=UPI000C6E15C8|nr:uncharacterized protein LOC111638044 [Centruroides sculpturatus]
MAKEKCICQLCTCGNHRCIHFPVGNDISTTCPNGVDDEDQLKSKRKQWEVSPEHVQKIYKSYQVNEKENMTNHSMKLQDTAITKQLKGNGENTRKPLHASNIKEGDQFQTYKRERKEILKLDGKMEYTIHKNDMAEKQIEKYEQKRPTTTLKTEGQIQSQSIYQKEYKSTTEKPNNTTGTKKAQNEVLKKRNGTQYETTTNIDYPAKKIEIQKHTRPKTSYRQEGSMDLKTTTQQSFKVPPIEKTQRIRPQQNLTSEQTPFIDDTTTKSEYKQWNITRTDIRKPKENLRQEGEMDFSTTAQADFVPKEAERARGQRPPTTSKYEGDMDLTTTAQSDFVGKQTERVRGQRPMTTSKYEGDMDLTTTTQQSFQVLPMEKTKSFKPEQQLIQDQSPFIDDTTTKSEYKQWNITRSDIRKPKENLRQEGEMDFSTTAQADFVPKEAERARGQRPPTTSKYEGDMDLTTTAQSDFVGKQTERVRGQRPMTTSKYEGDMDLTTTTQQSFQVLPMEKTQSFKPEQLIQDQSPFLDTTTTRSEFKQWNLYKNEVRKPTENLKQGGETHFSTTTQTDFTSSARRKVIDEFRKSNLKNSFNVQRNRDSHIFENGKFEKNGKTNGYHGHNVTFLHQFPTDANYKTTTQSSYQGLQTDRPNALRPKSSLYFLNRNGIKDSEKNFNGFPIHSTSHSEFGKSESFVRTKAARPPTSQKVGEGLFDTRTTNQVTFIDPSKQAIQRINLEKPPNHRIFESGGAFDGGTTYASSFTPTGLHCPVLDIDAKYSYKGELGGHKFYLPVVQN